MANPLPAALRRLYPFEPRTFTTPGGARMSYLDEGPRTGPVVVMLHGNPTWSFFYRDLVREVGGALRCIVPDHVGMGLSEKPQDYPYTLEQRIRDVEALLAHLGATRIRLVVHDWGGAIGFGFATRRPEQIERITILNTAAWLSKRIPRRIALCRAGVAGKVLVRGFNGFAGPATWMTTHRRALSADEKRGYLHPYRSWADRVAVHQFVADIPLEAGHRSRATLAAVENALPSLAAVPKQIVWGGRDFCFNDHFLAQWQAVYPEAEVHRHADVGHYLLDDGGPELRGVVREFLLRP